MGGERQEARGLRVMSVELYEVRLISGNQKSPCLPVPVSPRQPY